jgi:hypothetical protein
MSGTQPNSGSLLFMALMEFSDVTAVGTPL